MILWINGAFGSGKTTAAHELNRRLPGSYVFDPESFGFCLFENLPEECCAGDFQDIPLWRETNRKMLAMIDRDYPGTVIVPMTLAAAQYWDEIIGQLRRDGVDVRHFILYASRETLTARLQKRALGDLSREQFALDAIERCMTAFDTGITEGIVQTDGREIDDVVNEIASRAGLTLTPART
ncbi:MAG: AAA family ATPase [Clostridia bacterium]|nr:AAA family ATPase [Clostridia bacterium]MBQ8368900.1 AAA family ATPase [Clostridia bacterium]MBQ8513314.1 AAA family ATPase [Clostridia bacterium]